MPSKWKNIVEADWLQKHISDSNLVIVDCRFNLEDPEEGKKQYEAGHIPNALYFDLNEDLSGPVKEHGGRHPLPEPTVFLNKLEKSGINETVTVVAYDDQNGMVAARFWWMLKYFGHPAVHVLDGGFSHWVEKNYPVSTKIPSPIKRTFQPKANEEMVVDMKDVQEQLHRLDTVLVDSRSAERYLGVHEPLDSKAGHIPGAVNFFWGENVKDGKWDKELIKHRFDGLKEKEEIIVYCGSGVSACSNILAMDEAGLQNIKLYNGSWSDWSSYTNNPVETKKRMI